MSRVGSAVAYYGVNALFWALVTAVHAGLTMLAFASARHVVDALAGMTLVFVCAALVCGIVVLDVDDWWDDFREQNRLAVVCGALLVATLLSGIGIGWWIMS
ncbi:hypothetical protein Areg01_79050 [Actinoplanes regularis]|nr:hypothetical protein Areg01_79050 [Actinoplanes regularis]